MSLFKIEKIDGLARAGTLNTIHGEIKTPAFMNVGTLAAIKGAVSSIDLIEMKCQVVLSNTYHLHLRPGDEIIKKMGGLNKFMNWTGPILTDSGGFQVFSLASISKVQDEGVCFYSHLDGNKIFLSPENSMQIQSNLASTIAMAFDECIGNPAERGYVKNSIKRTTRWLERCKNKLMELNSKDETINRNQLLFGINQGGIYPDLRIEHMKEILELDLDGYGIGGLAVGESEEIMYEILECLQEYIPKDRPRYLMGVGTPLNILKAIECGIDLFDCVMPARNARHGNLFTENGPLRIINSKYKLDDRPIQENCKCTTCKNYSKSYIRHLFKAKEMLAMRLSVIHNLYFYNNLMDNIRSSILNNEFQRFKREFSLCWNHM